MFGNNPKREAIIGNGDTLFIKNIFKTIQGEGPNVGTPAIFIRLGGCNLACSFCDTEFEDFNQLALVDIIQRTQQLSLNTLSQSIIKLIVITGGEPMRQPIAPLCSELIKLGYKIQIETNGTLFRDLPNEVEIICSPKVVNGKYHNVRPDLLTKINAFKFLIADNLKEYNCIPDFAKQARNIPIYIQPMDQYDPILNLNNLNLTIKLSLEQGYKLSVQTHKVIGVE